MDDWPATLVVVFFIVCASFLGGILWEKLWTKPICEPQTILNLRMANL